MLLTLKRLIEHEEGLKQLSHNGELISALIGLVSGPNLDLSNQAIDILLSLFDSDERALKKDQRAALLSKANALNVTLSKLVRNPSGVVMKHGSLQEMRTNLIELSDLLQE